MKQFRLRNRIKKFRQPFVWRQAPLDIWFSATPSKFSALTQQKLFGASGPTIIRQRTKKCRYINGGIDDRKTWEWDVEESQHLPEADVKEMQHWTQPRPLAKPYRFRAVRK
jgi:hypothetical protein